MSEEQSKINYFYELKEGLGEKVEEWKGKNGIEGAEEYIRSITEAVFLGGFLLKRLRDELLNDNEQ